MTSISKNYDFTQGTAANASEVNANFDTIYNDYNGSISSTNLAASAITTAKIADANVTTAKIADANVTYAKLLSTIFSGQVQTYTNAGTAGGAGHYVNLGGIKLYWGVTASIATTTTAIAKVINMPASFFTTVQTAYVGVASLASTPTQATGWADVPTTAYGSIYVWATAGSGSQTVSWLVIGT